MSVAVVRRRCCCGPTPCECRATDYAQVPAATLRVCGSPSGASGPCPVSGVVRSLAQHGREFRVVAFAAGSIQSRVSQFRFSIDTGTTTTYEGSSWSRVSTVYERRFTRTAGTGAIQPVGGLTVVADSRTFGGSGTRNDTGGSPQTDLAEQGIDSAFLPAISTGSVTIDACPVPYIVAAWDDYDVVEGFSSTLNTLSLTPNTPNVPQLGDDQFTTKSSSSASVSNPLSGGGAAQASGSWQRRYSNGQSDWMASYQADVQQVGVGFGGVVTSRDDITETSSASKRVIVVPITPCGGEPQFSESFAVFSPCNGVGETRLAFPDEVAVPIGAVTRIDGECYTRIADATFTEGTSWYSYVQANASRIFAAVGALNFGTCEICDATYAEFQSCANPTSRMVMRTEAFARLMQGFGLVPGAAVTLRVSGECWTYVGTTEDPANKTRYLNQAVTAHSDCITCGANLSLAAPPAAPPPEMVDRRAMLTAEAAFRGGCCGQ